MLKKIIIAFLLIVCVVFLAGVTFIIIKSIPPHINRDKINEEAYRREAKEHLIEKYSTEFDILEQTGNTDEYVVVEYFASPEDNSGIIFTVTFGYFFPAIGLVPPFWERYTMDNFGRGIGDYFVDQYAKENPINITDKSQFKEVEKKVLDLTKTISTALRDYHAKDLGISLPMKILGNDVTVSASVDFDSESFLHRLNLEYEKQLAINSGDPAYDYEFEYAWPGYFDVNVVMIDYDNINIELESHYYPVILTGYKEYRKSGEFAYLYIKSTVNDDREMETYAFDYDVSDLNEVYVCDGDGRADLIWSRESDDLTE